MEKVWRLSSGTEFHDGVMGQKIRQEIFDFLVVIDRRDLDAFPGKVDMHPGLIGKSGKRHMAKFP